ncbi:MAG: thiamine-monophosphate kinase [Verrucomicrobiaceae bacterium]|nr:thiamine-monophosphate kinase [Verrucomicrobiaceae bacterium]
MQTLSDIGEDSLIHRLVDGLPQDASVIIGPGDDCAVVKTEGPFQLLKTDAVVEGVHFLREAPAHLVGRKALARAVSDMAAMGGLPRHALITLVLPQDLEVSYVEGLYKGLDEVAREWGISIVGGETTRGLQIVISVALTGICSAFVRRSTARVDDAIMVTGTLGGSIAGRHFTFPPRVKEAQWLMRHFRPTAMMDVSDGLGKDLPRLAAASGIGFVIDVSTLPCTPGCTPEQAWGDGEDYELLFTLKDIDGLDAAWKAAFPQVPLTLIGHTVPAGCGCLPRFNSTGWDPFTTPT